MAVETTRLTPETVEPRRQPWLFSPWVDLLFIANVAWILAFLPGFVDSDGQPFSHFWTVYFLATPHRWLTLFLVAADPQCRAGREVWFAGIAVAVGLLVAMLYVLAGNLELLAFGYAVLVAWHFAAQHSGILRIYSRRRGTAGWRSLEIWGPRFFVTYAGLRILPGFDRFAAAAGLPLETLDWAFLAIPCAMVLAELSYGRAANIPKLLYMLSFSSLFAAVIFAARAHDRALCLALFTAATAFHSIEYMAVVFRYVQRRGECGADAPIRAFSRNVPLALAWYIVGSGVIYAFGNQLLLGVWFAVNLWASILHCAFDGMIWKLRRRTLGEVFELK